MKILLAIGLGAALFGYVCWLVHELLNAPDEHELWHDDHDECVKFRDSNPS